MRVARCIVLAIFVVSCGESGPTPPLGSLAGTWGGDDAGFIVSDTGAHTHIGCTKGDVVGAIVPDESGRFDVAGEYNINAYPVDLGIRHPARFIGQVDGRRLSLTVVLTDTLVSFGPVSLTYGREPEMAVCPICVTPHRDAPAPDSTSLPAARQPAVPSS